MKRKDKVTSYFLCLSAAPPRKHCTWVSGDWHRKSHTPEPFCSQSLLVASPAGTCCPHTAQIFLYTIPAAWLCLSVSPASVCISHPAAMCQIVYSVPLYSLWDVVCLCLHRSGACSCAAIIRAFVLTFSSQWWIHSSLPLPLCVRGTYPFGILVILHIVGLLQGRPRQVLVEQTWSSPPKQNTLSNDNWQP